jgi:biotin transport system substrate-specific component
MTEIAVMTAIMCVMGPWVIPIGPVPISLGTLAVMLSVYILGTRKGTVACLVYILLGTLGLPVFSGFSGGFGKLAGPTGGYLIGYLFLALIGGWFIHRFYTKIHLQFLGLLLGIAVCYAFGTAWLAYVAHMTAGAALAAGTLPFIPFDVAKAVIAILLGRTLRERLLKAGVLTAA